MSASQHDGGPAFPTDSDRVESPFTKAYPGMSLRDYFAAKAMAGSLAGEPGPHLVPHTLAREAYAIADAMLKARNPT